MRLIDADALIEKGYWHGKRPDIGHPYPDGVDAVDTADIEDAPTIDPESLGPTGEWISFENKWVAGIPWNGKSCSNCNFTVRFKTEFNYCPNCGAKMKEAT